MKIDRKNYEIFFTDYLDGNLSGDQVILLMAFLSENPDLEEELAGIKEFCMQAEADDIVFTGKSSLKKSVGEFMITNDNFEHSCVARIEGDLSENDSALFDRYIEMNPDKGADYYLFKKTILTPDINIVYENKARLKKFQIGKRTSKNYWKFASVAAAAVMVLLVYFNISNDNSRGILTVSEDISGNKNSRKAVIDQQAGFAIIGTETPSLVAGSTTGSITKNNEGRKRQYVDPGKALFVSNYISNIRSFAPGSEEINHQISARPAAEKNKSNDIGHDDQTEIQNISILKLNPNRLSQITSEIHSDEYINDLLKNIPIINGNSETQNDPGVSFWDIAETGIRSYSKLTGKNVVVEKKLSEQGNVASLSINTRNFHFSKKIKNR